MNKILNYGRQFVDNHDQVYLSKALKSKILTGGKYVNQLESVISNKIKCKYVVSCNSGTSGIYLALSSINLKKGDNVIIPAINFAAAANICKLKGANIFFSDVNELTFQSGKSEIEDCIKKNKLNSIKVIFTMHLGGPAIHQREVYELKKKYNCILIEDACHALGAKYPNSNLYVGSSKYSDFSIFSLHPVKSVTSGEGGLVCTNKKTFFKSMLSLRSHGIINRKDISYDIVNSSLNFRISDLNCALAVSQFKKIDKFIFRRKQIVLRYQKKLKNLEKYLKIINLKYLNYSAWHLLIIKFDVKNSFLNLNKIFNYLKKNNIICQQHYIPTYKFKVFKMLNKHKNSFNNSEKYHISCLSFPIYYSLSNKDVDYICDKLTKKFKT